MQPAAIVDGRYQLLGVLGAGGMGTVHRAVRLADGLPVALKTLHAGNALDEGAATRLRREARILCALKSPNAVRMIDAGQLASGEPYLVMELLEGFDLASLVRSEGPFPPDVVAQILRDACHALEEAHAHGVFHRDLKPQNLFLARGPDRRLLLKVLDFGLGTRPSLATAAASAYMTRAGDFLGTPNYMAPEQVRDPTLVEARSDVYALGATAYSLLSAALPFDGNNVAVIMAEVLNGQPRPLAAITSGVPGELIDIVERCMAKDPALRFSDCRSLRLALDGLAFPAVATVAAPRTPRASARVGVLFALALLGVAVGAGARLGPELVASSIHPR